MNIQIAKAIFLLTISLLLCQDIAAQIDTGETKVRNIIATTPVNRNTVINGLAIGLIARSWQSDYFLEINGVNIDVLPLGAFAGFLAVFGTIFAPLNMKKDDDILYSFSDKSDIETIISGFSFSVGGLLRNIHCSGVGVNGVVSFAESGSGVEITGLMNLHYDFEGVMFAGLRNKSTKCSGVQIGLINTCREGNVVQIGLINRINKRVIPFVNFQFKKKVKRLKDS